MFYPCTIIIEQQYMILLLPLPNISMKIAEYDVDTPVFLSNFLLVENEHKYPSNPTNLKEENILVRIVLYSNYRATIYYITTSITTY